MEATSGVDLCRVTVVAPRTRMDLALPTDAPLSDLLPTLLRFAGENPEDPAFLRGGWVLQRLGDQALDPSQRFGNLGLRDGDVLYLRHREAGIPEFAFDDVADAIQTATRTKRAAWQPKDTKLTSLIVSGVFFFLGTLLALSSGPGWLIPGILSFVAAAGLLYGGWSLSRGSGQSQVGAFLGACSVAYAAIGGFLIFGPGKKGIGGFGAEQFTVSMAFALVFATISAIAIVAGWNGFFGAAAAALIGGLASLSVLFLGVSAPAAAAVAAAIALGSAPVLPTLCARLAKLPIPQLPTSSEELRKQTDVLPGPTVLQQALTADRLMSGLLGASAAICVAASFFIAGLPTWFGPALAGVLGLALILRARHFRGRSQRLWLLCGGIACIVLLIVGMVSAGGSRSALLFAVGVPCLIVGAALAAWAVGDPERRLSPYWGRMTDILEVLVLLMPVPLMLGVLDVYQGILDKFFA